MLTPLLIIARMVQIAASILFAGIFTFDLVMLAPDGRLGSGDFHEIEAHFLGFPNGVLNAHDAELLPCGRENHAHFLGADASVDPNVI